MGTEAEKLDSGKRRTCRTPRSARRIIEVRPLVADSD